MHSDFWAGLPDGQCPPNIQQNRSVIRRMDAFYDVARANKAALDGYVDALACGQHPARPVLDYAPDIADQEMEFMMDREIAEAKLVVVLSRGTEKALIAHYIDEWGEKMRRAGDYLLHNRKALKKRYARNSEQREIDRVQKLIDDGETEIRLLEQRIAWGIQKLEAA